MAKRNWKITLILLAKFTFLLVSTSKTVHLHEKNTTKIDQKLSLLATLMSRGGLNLSDEEFLNIAKLLELAEGRCRSIPFNQTIKNDQCSATVRNNICFGATPTFKLKEDNIWEMYITAHCKIEKITLKGALLNCPGNSVVSAKVDKVNMVESCKEVLSFTRKKILQEKVKENIMNKF